MCLWTCIMNFWAGFILVSSFLPFAKKLSRKSSLILSLVLILIIAQFFLFPLPFNKQESCTILAVLVYMLLTLLSGSLTVPVPVEKTVRIISRYSYGIFLVHHVTLYGVMWLVKGFTFSWISSMIFFIPLFTLILLLGLLLITSSNALVNGISRLLRTLPRSGKAADM